MQCSGTEIECIASYLVLKIKVADVCQWVLLPFQLYKQSNFIFIVIYHENNEISNHIKTYSILLRIIFNIKHNSQNSSTNVQQMTKCKYQTWFKENQSIKSPKSLTNLILKPSIIFLIFCVFNSSKPTYEFY